MVEAATSELSFESLIANIDIYLQTHERVMLKKAYDTAQDAHAGQKRRSGEDYFVHCVEVSRILVDLQMDAVTIAAGLLHDIVEDTDWTVGDIVDTFGSEVARLVEGVTKLEAIPLETNPESGKKQDREAEYLRKTLLAMDDDVRVMLIKLADRLHNMRTLGYLSRERQLRMARETMDIFAPVASRLGIWQMKWELEDLAFRYLEPENYKFIANLIANRRTEREQFILHIKQSISTLLSENGINAEISGRSKHIFSIWNKMQRKRLPFSQIYDVHAVRIIVSNTMTCYQVLGLIHQQWRPIPEEFDDYIAAPKDNFYQSLHTAVILEDGKTLEVQIRTHDMHVHAELGVAAHWRYKEGNPQADTKASDAAFNRRIAALRDMMEVGRSVDDPDEFLDVMRTDVFEDRVYVFTPRGDIVDLPSGSTPIDFAYHVHTEVGNRCRGAKVNGKLVPLHYKLQVGDRIEILTAGRGGPSRDWLNPNLEFVKTKRAASKIRQWFRKQDREKMVGVGREHLSQELKRLAVDNASHDELANLLGVDRVDDMYAQIGFGDIHPQQVAAKLLELGKQDEEAAPHDAVPVHSTAQVEPDISEVAVQGVKGLLTNLARCCNPVQGDEITGYITVGRGVTIHRKDCPNVLNLPTQRLIEVDWGTEGVGEKYPVPVTIRAYDREGLMRDIGTAVADEHINIREISVSVRSNIALFNVTLEVTDTSQLSRILSRIEQLPNVMEARRNSQ